MSEMMSRQRSVRPTTAIVRAVATVRGVDPTDLQRPLFEAVDPDALDALFDSNLDGMSVSFEYHGHRVELRGDMTVLVDGTVVDPSE